IEGLKASAKALAPKVKDDKDFDKFEADLLKKHSKKPAVTAADKPAEGAPGAQPPANTPDAGKPEDKPAAEGDVKTTPEAKDKEAPEPEDSTKDKDKPKPKEKVGAAK
ncbi:MAG TPA: hypothetical protein V6C72_05200, partial [Chroococcales cyanobacterium]